MIEKIRRRQANLQFGLAGQHLLALPFLLAGWISGFVWWVIRFWISSFVEGWLYWIEG